MFFKLDFMRQIVLISVFILLCLDVYSNNVRIGSEVKVVGFTSSADTAIVEFNLTWENSWRDDFNWDATWIFLKYRKMGETEEWNPVYMEKNGHEIIPAAGESGNYTFMCGELGPYVTGVYLMRKEKGVGHVDVKLRLKWPLQANPVQPLTKEDFGEKMDRIFVAAYAVEMVYIPMGAYYLGDNSSTNSFVKYGTDPSFIMDGENPVNLGTELKANDGQSWGGMLSASYPKGYRGFYCMKYEVSQEQYVEFLNALTLQQQKTHVTNNRFENMKRGDYVFGDLKRADNRNGIAFLRSRAASAPVVFGCNLNPNNDFFSADDGQTIACNFLSPVDMVAYCDWAGLRPMSEMEYEKICRQPALQKPVAGAYAWGSSELTSASGLQDGGTDSERLAGGNVNGGSATNLGGPVRCGAFAGNAGMQKEAGATYWGVMEMSGNLWEMCYNANAAGRNLVADHIDYSHGDGYLTLEGMTDVSADYWPDLKTAFAVRGGSFLATAGLLRISDRTNAFGTFFSDVTQRRNDVGFRAVRSVLSTSSVIAGTIICQNGLQKDSVCLGTTYTIKGEPARDMQDKPVYQWYISKDGGVSWQSINGANGLTLTYSGFTNTSAMYQSLMFKRKVTGLSGEATSGMVTLMVSPVVKIPLVENRLFPILEKSFLLPCPKNGNWQCKWEFPGGYTRTGTEVRIDKYIKSFDGNYKVNYVNDAGCESDKVAVKLEGIEGGIPVIDFGDHRSWADGTYAKSASEYMNPGVEPYVGSSVSGVYRIDPDGRDGVIEPFDVYCDMQTNGGGWMLVMMGGKNTTTFNYASTYWTDDRLLNEKQANVNANQDMKNMGFLTLPVKQVFIRMTLVANNRSLDFFEKISSTNCKSLFSTQKLLTASDYTIDQLVNNYGLDALYGITWQRGNPKIGFSIGNVRYGIKANQSSETGQANENSHDSGIGLGGRKYSAGAWAEWGETAGQKPADFSGSFWLYVK